MNLSGHVIILLFEVSYKRSDNVLQLIFIIKSKVAEIPVGDYELQVVSHSDLHLDERSGGEGVSHNSNQHVQHVNNQEECSQSEKNAKEDELAAQPIIIAGTINLPQNKLPDVPDGINHCGVANIGLLLSS